MTQSIEYSLIRFVQPGIPLAGSQDTVATSERWRITLTADGERVELLHRQSGKILEVFRDRVLVLERDARPAEIKKAANG